MKRFLRKGLEKLVLSLVAGAMMLGVGACIDRNKPDCWYEDNDTDEYNTCSSYMDECIQAKHNPCGDCNDSNNKINPGMIDEPCDDIDSNCDGYINHDEDGDGHGSGCGDCDDLNPYTFPGAPEICDGEDTDCDGLIGDGEGDLDLDGYMPCEGDCDDEDSNTFPGAEEICDGNDNNCDELIPNNEADLDGDSYLACYDDCDDLNPYTFPGAPEICDGLDNNCDYILPDDELDLDFDGYIACEDCDDNNPNVHPGALEVCDGFDNDCDGLGTDGEIDGDGDGYMECDDCDDTDYDINPGVDLDGDGYGACEDCDDNDPIVNPATPEVCNGLDDNCNGVIDDHLSLDGEADATYLGEDSGDLLGSVTAMGNSDADGYDDIILGSPTNSSGAVNGGKVYVVLGDAAIGGDFDIALIADADFTGTDADAYAGMSICANESLDYNNYDDILVGSLTDGYLAFSGPLLSGSYNLSSVDVKFTNANGDGVQYVAAMPNGADDILAYNDWTSTNDGLAHLVNGLFSFGTYGITSSQVDLEAGVCTANCETDEEDFGKRVILTSDLDGDGTVELVVANDKNDNDTGKVYGIEENSLTGTINLDSSADFTITGENPGDRAGHNVAVGDFDGDGVDDLAIAAPGAGRVYVFLNTPSGNLSVNDADIIIDAETGYERLGSGLAAGDFNGDGIDDLAIGANNIVYIVDDFNSLGSSVQLGVEPSIGSFVLDTPIADNGMKVSVNGDVDGDGHDDLVAGSPKDDENGADAGKVYLVKGGGCN